MGKNSTLRFKGDLSEEESKLYYKQLAILHKLSNQRPRRKTIDNIIAYAASLRPVRTKSGNNILVLLN